MTVLEENLIDLLEETVKRGAKPNDQDAEIRRILNKKKGKDRQEMIEHLLTKGPKRFLG